MNSERCRVAIVGAGPSGLSVASELSRLGVDDVVVLEREAAAGGIPRHCGHSPFGMREFYRILSGPAYARRLQADALELGVRIRLGTAVTEFAADGSLQLASDSGMSHLHAQKVVVCTGNREQPRAPRLVSGSRPPGVITTGALQSMTFLKKRIPFRRPLIVGSEMIAFSALLTCRQFGIKPVAMIEQQPRITAWRLSALLPALLGTRLLTGTSLEAIHGQHSVTGVDLVNRRGEREYLECDGLIFCGNFVAESSVLQKSHLDIDNASQAPAVDQFGRCSDEDYFACGNLLHPVDTAGWCWAEGRRLARNVAASLNGGLEPAARVIGIRNASPLIRYFTPQRIVLPNDCGNDENPGIQIRISENRRGRLSLRADGRPLVERKLTARREQRILLPLPRLRDLPDSGTISLEFNPS